MSTLVVIGYDNAFKTSLSHDDEAKLQAALSAAKK